MVRKLPVMQETWDLFLGWKDALEKGMATHSSILSWRIPWTEQPVGYSLQDRKELDTTEQLTLSLFKSHGGFPSDTAVENTPAMQEPQEMRVRSLGQEDCLEEDMAIHSSILGWRIPSHGQRSLVGSSS